MVLILRIHTMLHGRQYFKEFGRIGCNLFSANRCCFKRITSSLQVKNFSTEEKQANVDKSISQIYYGRLSSQIRLLKIFTLVTSVGSLAVQPFLYMKAAETDNMVAIIFVFTFIGAIAVVSPLLINLVTKKYVTSLHYDAKNDKYIATVYNLFVQKRKIEFTVDDVRVPDVPGIFVNCIANNTPIFLDPPSFTDESHYIRIMGFDKPIDLHLRNVTETETTCSSDKSKQT